MDHQQALLLLPAYVDQELSISEALAMEHHLDSCEECQREYAEQSGIRALFKHNTVNFEASPELSARIKNTLPPSPKPVLPILGWHLGWMNMATALVSLLMLVWSGSLFLALPSSQDKLAGELIASHVRSLQVSHLSDVISTDQHTVKPWFNGKLDYAPPVVNLTPQGFPLSGGRLDYINGRNVAVLVYHRRQHPINLYIWPTQKSATLAAAMTQQGYHVLHWVNNGMEFWAVSDVAAAELDLFGITLRSQIN